MAKECNPLYSLDASGEPVYMRKIASLIRTRLAVKNKRDPLVPTLQAWDVGGWVGWLLLLHMLEPLVACSV